MAKTENQRERETTPSMSYMLGKRELRFGLKHDRLVKAGIKKDAFICGIGLVMDIVLYIFLKLRFISVRLKTNKINVMVG